MLNDLDKHTVNFIPTYDGSYREPMVLPSSVPNLLLNGADGIAVGMATKIPPHNLNEVSDGLTEMINRGNKWENADKINYDYIANLKTKEDLKSLDDSIFPQF